MKKLFLMATVLALLAIVMAPTSFGAKPMQVKVAAAQPQCRVHEVHWVSVTPELKLPGEGPSLKLMSHTSCGGVYNAVRTFRWTINGRPQVGFTPVIPAPAPGERLTVKLTVSMPGAKSGSCPEFTIPKAAPPLGPVLGVNVATC